MKLWLQCLALQLGGGAATAVVGSGKEAGRKAAAAGRKSSGRGGGEDRGQPSGAVANFEFCQGLLQLTLQVREQFRAGWM